MVAAWGNNIKKRPFLKECLKDIYKITDKNNKEWLCFGINKIGYPKHPLYIKQNKEKIFHVFLRTHI